MKAILSILCAVVLFGCTRSKSVSTPVNSDLIAAFNYKPGTYWIYRDSISGEIDSFFVTDNFSSSLINSGAGTSVDDILILISQVNSLSSNSIKNKWQYRYESDMFDVNFIDSINKYELYFTPLTNYPDFASHNLCSGCDYFTTDSIYSIVSNSETFTIGGYTFSDVLEINHIAACSHATVPNNNYGYYNDIFYLSKSAGIVKMVLNHTPDSLNVIWELQRYKIIK